MNNSSITAAVYLETMWETKKKDLIDLVSPFVFYAVGISTNVGDVIDANLIRNTIEDEFGYDDMPLAVIDAVLKRNNKSFKKMDKKYVLDISLDEDVEKMKHKKEESATKKHQKIYMKTFGKS